MAFSRRWSAARVGYALQLCPHLVGDRIFEDVVEAFAVASTTEDEKVVVEADARVRIS